MQRSAILAALLKTKIIAIIRLSNAAQVYPTANALLKGEVNAVEVTMGTPNAIEEIRKLAELPNILLGVGSVVNPKTVNEAAEAGAQYIVTPVSKKEVIEEAHRLGKPIFSGALTPKEVLQAYEWGADVVKLFPAETFGLSYFKAIRAPMPYIPMMPTGGVSIENAAEWLKNGAVCLGVGSALINKQLIEDKDFERITELAKNMRNEVDKIEDAI